jgi:uncharacterized protein (DUF2384 family)
MNEEPEDGLDTAPAPDAKPEIKRFRRKFTTNRLAPDAAERQGRVARIAWEKLGNRDAMLAFLNTHDDALGGRPIDLAVESAAGLAAVEKLLAERAG